jgi:hemoglobin/transferrin/lactoferrin receptor protein
MRAFSLLLCGSTLLCASIAQSNDDRGGDADRADAASLEAITVTATRVPQPVGDVAATVSVIDADEIERRNARDIAALVRYEPGVSVAEGLTRFGPAGFNIRGLEGNRVLIEVDGVRQPDGFAIGSFSNATRNGIDLDTIKQVEILRGPSSGQYGSNALGGVVSFITKDPGDFLDADAGAYLRLRAGGSSEDDGTLGAFTSAVRLAPAWSALVSFNRRRFAESDSFGRDDARDATRTRPNPQRADSDSLLAKWVFEPSDTHRLRLTAERFDADTRTEVLSALGLVQLGPTGVLVESLDGEDSAERSRRSFEWSFTGFGPFAEGSLQFDAQDASTEQLTHELRTTIAPSGARTPLERRRRFLFEQDVASAEAVFRSDFSTGAVEQRLVYGVERIETQSAQLRDGTQRNLTTGAVTSVIQPDAFPVRDFPLSEVVETGLFIENEMRLLDGRLTLVPGLRHDRYRLEPELDPIFRGDNPGIAPVALEEQRTSPRLGTVWRLDEHWSAHLNIASGFRAPPVNDVNIGFTNLAFGYTAIPNPELASETSRGAELGLRLREDSGYAALTLFANEYDDFIESLASLGVDPTTRLLVFQSRNLDRVTIHGAELRAALALGALHPRMSDFSFDAALSWARGEDQRRDQPLNSIDPARAVLGISWAPQTLPLTAELLMTAAERKRRIDESAGPLFASPGYAVFDLHLRWHLGDVLRLDLSGFNLADRRWFAWPNVRGRPANDPAIERFSSAGRSVAATLTAEF